MKQEFNFARYSKQKKKEVKLTKKRHKKPKKVKGYVPVLTHKVDCSDMFKMKGTELSVQYSYNRENGRDLFFDIRMTNSTKEIKPKKFDTVMVTVNGGKVGLKRMMKFLMKNEGKFIKIRKGIIRMTKGRK